MSAIRSEDMGSSVSLVFRGSKVSVVGGTSREGGMAAVYIDDEPVGMIDLYAAEEHAEPVVAGFDTSGYGRHTLRIEVTGERPPGSAGTLVTIDAIDVN
jgi:hypothetical protein